MHRAVAFLLVATLLAVALPSRAGETTYPANTPYAVEERGGWRVEVWMNTAPGKDRPFNVTVLVYDAATRARIEPAATLEILRPNRTALASVDVSAGERIGVLTRPDAAGTHTIRVAFTDTDGRHDLAVAVEVKAFKERRTPGLEGPAALALAAVVAAASARRVHPRR
ncbi:MAG TPA: hypothetical protein VM889_01085 [Candidatus Thermoplasmatota archaeon]|nr:hypothetical protein [Candidatus Thermoplasmatota archaeon]